MEVCTLSEMYSQLRITPEISTPEIDSQLLLYRAAAIDKVAGAIGYTDDELTKLEGTRSWGTFKVAVLTVVAWLFENREMSAEDFPEGNLFCLISHLKKI